MQPSDMTFMIQVIVEYETLGNTDFHKNKKAVLVFMFTICTLVLHVVSCRSSPSHYWSGGHGRKQTQALTLLLLLSIWPAANRTQGMNDSNSGHLTCKLMTCFFNQWFINSWNWNIEIPWAKCNIHSAAMYLLNTTDGVHIVMCCFYIVSYCVLVLHEVVLVVALISETKCVSWGKKPKKLAF